MTFNDPMLYLKLADNLKAQADSVLQRIKLALHIEKLGQLYFTGSYALNLMTWNDIDMQIALKEGMSPTNALLQLLGAFVHETYFVKAQVINFSEDYKPHWPRGYCLCLNLNLPELGGIWKFDIWTLEQKDSEKNQTLIHRLENSLTEETRVLILQIKHELMKASGKMPKMGSYWLYQAVLIKGLRDKSVILNFLLEKGVELDSSL